jgi:DNA-binding SARP family transcriptional activator/Tol biopolymer transport system component
MIELRVLGPVDLRGHDGEALLSVLSQPKRLTLLAYLALNATAGFTRRDKLLGLFWPDSETERARASLRRSLSWLRKSLGEEVLVTRGNEDVGIAAGTLECDAVRFEALLEKGDPESAMALYAGPFLDGVFVSETMGLESWLEYERSRFTRLAGAAANAIADRRERQGDVGAAVDWTRKAVALEPESEVGIRRLIGLHARAGDNAAALRTYEEFAARLREEFDIEPSDETRSLVETVRASSSSSTPAVDARGSAFDARDPATGAGTPQVVQEGAVGHVSRPARNYGGLLYAASLSIAALIIVLALWGWLRSSPDDPVLRYSMVFPEGEEMVAPAGRRFAISPDGTILVYVSQPERRLRVRRRDQLHGAELPGTERAVSPFFSPDGKRVGFFANGALKIASLGGGPIVVITKRLDWSRGASWGPDGFIYASLSDFSGLARVLPEPGAVPQPFTQLDSTRRESNHQYPDVLPDGRGVVFTIAKGAVTGSTSSIGVADLETGSHKELVDGLYARYAPSGNVVWVALDSTLMVAPFDPQAMKLTGPATVVSARQRVGFRFAVDVAVSATGTLVYATGPGEGPRELVWVNRDGTVEPLDTTWQGGFGYPSISPDGTRLVVTMASPDGVDIWVRQMESGATLKLTGEATVNGYPSWTPDGRSVTYFSNQSGSAQLWTKPADGSAHAKLELGRPRDLAESVWSPDGRWLIYRTSNVPRAVPGALSAGAADILAIRPGTGENEPIPLATTEFTEVGPALSPDGHWLAYSSQETGKEEVFVVPFPSTGAAKWPISPEGGTEPVWAHDGRELFYRDGRGSMHAVEVRTAPTFSIGRNTVLFDDRGFVLSGLHPMYTVSPDDRRLLMVRQVGEPDPGELIVVENWFSELKEAKN